MARKNDPQIQEDVDRKEKSEPGAAGIDSRNNSYNDEEADKESDEIKNANAAGLGAMGRNDQMQTDHTSNHSSDAADE